MNLILLQITRTKSTVWNNSKTRNVDFMEIEVEGEVIRARIRQELFEKLKKKGVLCEEPAEEEMVNRGEEICVCGHRLEDHTPKSKFCLHETCSCESFEGVERNLRLVK